MQKYDYFVNLEINTRKISKKRNFSGYETLINVSIVRWNLKEAVSKFSARRTGSGYIERVCKAKQNGAFRLSAGDEAQPRIYAAGHP